MDAARPACWSICLTLPACLEAAAKWFASKAEVVGSRDTLAGDVIRPSGPLILRTALGRTGYLCSISGNEHPASRSWPVKRNNYHSYKGSLTNKQQT